MIFEYVAVWKFTGTTYKCAEKVIAFISHKCSSLSVIPFLLRMEKNQSHYSVGTQLTVSYLLPSFSSPLTFLLKYSTWDERDPVPTKTTYRSLEQERKSRDKPTSNLWHRENKEHCRKKVSSIKRCWESWTATRKEWN